VRRGLRTLRERRAGPTEGQDPPPQVHPAVLFTKGAAMAALVSSRVRMLLDQPRRPGMMVSCYADTSASEGFAARWLQPVKAEATRIGLELAGNQQARREFERNVEAIRRALESPVARQARGMAVFAAIERGFFLALTGSEPYENRLGGAGEPYRVPLFGADFPERALLAMLAQT